MENFKGCSKCNGLSWDTPLWRTSASLRDMEGFDTFNNEELGNLQRMLHIAMELGRDHGQALMQLMNNEPLIGQQLRGPTLFSRSLNQLFHSMYVTPRQLALTWPQPW